MAGVHHTRRQITLDPSNSTLITSNIRRHGVYKNTLEGSHASHIVTGLLAGDAVAVCDGSYKQGKGAAGWVIEGSDVTGRLTGVTEVPGEITDHSSYRTELVGILATLQMLQVICHFHKIQAGSITIGCDNISALHNAFDTDFGLTLNHPDFDILYAIRQVLRLCPITCHPVHIKGHQNDLYEVQDLPRLAKIIVKWTNWPNKNWLKYT
jgi:hypothetical protein